MKIHSPVYCGNSQIMINCHLPRHYHSTPDLSGPSTFPHHQHHVGDDLKTIQHHHHHTQQHHAHHNHHHAAALLVHHHGQQHQHHTFPITTEQYQQQALRYQQQEGSQDGLSPRLQHHCHSHKNTKADKLTAKVEYISSTSVEIRKINVMEKSYNDLLKIIRNSVPTASFFELQIHDLKNHWLTITSEEQWLQYRQQFQQNSSVNQMRLRVLIDDVRWSKRDKQQASVYFKNLDEFMSMTRTLHLKQCEDWMNTSSFTSNASNC